ncbi:Cobalt-zinc-cadmium resistance protein [hydrothermal vent metagenome]|uniref:Cobalt-zinc-cadmium resistance protein n=1 Tax=hydrothermal vent metagenome TaxID=652676 RepID=A0A3B0ZS92_9ZZZZ
MSHSHSQLGHSRELRYKEVRRVTLIGSAVDLSLGAAKIVGGYVATSQALIADGVHSLSDLATDIIVLYAAKHSHREADEEHPYGHGRIETLATVVLGVALVLVSIGIGIDAVDRLFNVERLMQPTVLALYIALVSVIAKEFIYHFSMRIARKYRSEMLKANAWHSRTDAISSIIVVIGVIGSMAGLNYLDAIAAVGVAMMIAKIGWDLTFQSLRELIDTGLDPERVELIRNTIMDVNGVQALHVLRTRRMGGEALVDVHIQVSPNLSVSEGHHISEQVRDQLVRGIDEVSDVMVHIDPEDDEQVASSVGLPLRRDVLKQLKAGWSAIEGASLIRDEDITLHYLAGKIRIDLVLPLTLLENGPLATRDRIMSQFDRLVTELPDIDEIIVYYR